MEKIDITIIESLTTALTSSVDEYKSAKGTDGEQVAFFRMNFIKQFTTDVIFLNDLSENDMFYHRYIDLIMRNMIEQVIEFLYINKNRELVDEYLGYSIDLNKVKKKDIVVSETCFGGERFINTRAKISTMAKDIGEKKHTNRELSLYGIYIMLSEKCHNSYFGSLLEDINAIHIGISKAGLTKEHVTLIYIMVSYVLEEF